MKKGHAKLSLHIVHQSRDLTPICNSLGFKPRHIWNKGDDRITPKRSKIGGKRGESYCSIDLGTSPGEPLPVQIEAAINLLKPHRLLLRELSSSGGTVSFSVGWFLDEDAGDRFAWHIWEAMADMRIILDINVYLPDK